MLSLLGKSLIDKIKVSISLDANTKLIEKKLIIFKDVFKEYQK